MKISGAPITHDAERGPEPDGPDHGGDEIATLEEAESGVPGGTLHDNVTIDAALPRFTQEERNDSEDESGNTRDEEGIVPAVTGGDDARAKKTNAPSGRARAAHHAEGDAPPTRADQVADETGPEALIN